jgi:hypothetical protein
MVAVIGGCWMQEQMDGNGNLCQWVIGSVEMWDAVSMSESHQVACQESRGRVSVKRMPVQFGTTLLRGVPIFASLAKRLSASSSAKHASPTSPVCSSLWDKETGQVLSSTTRYAAG